LVDNELEPQERRKLALHAAVCPRCALTLGQLFAARVMLTLPEIGRIAMPRAFWRGVRERLNDVDSLIRATEVVPQRRRPVLSPGVWATGLTLIAVAFLFQFYFLQAKPVPSQLTRLHVQNSFAPGNPQFHGPISLRVQDEWRPVSRSLVNINGVMALHTIYAVGGIAVSIFRLPPGSINTSRLVSQQIGNRTVYLASDRGSNVIAMEGEGGWDIIVARGELNRTVDLATNYPRQWLGKQ
jgi:hypothetical protein